MKKHAFRSTLWSMLAFMGVMLISCGSDSKEEEIPTVTTQISPTSLSFTAEGSEKSVSITAAAQPVVSSSATWCTASSAASVSTNKYVLTVTAAANTETTSRDATLTVRVNDESHTIAVTQAAAEAKQETVNFATALKWYDTVDMSVDPIRGMGLGWNLGNQMDAYNNGVSNETCWGNPKVTQALFTMLKSSGISSVRIPVTWMGHIGEAPSYTIESAWLDRVAEIVGYAKAASLKVIINIHHDGADSAYWLDIKNAALNADTNKAIEDELAAVWTQIAEKFKNEGDYLVFESMNEIHDGGWGWGDNLTDGGKQYAVFNEWQQVFVDAVRAVGGENTNRYLGIPGYCTNADLTIKNLVLPTDPTPNRLMVAVHFYDPYNYTLSAQFGQWGHTAESGKKETWGDESNVITIFGNLKKAFADKGTPVYLGEMGCVHRTNTLEESFRKYYLEYVCKAAKIYGMTPFYWDNGGDGTGTEQSGLFNRETGAYLNNAADVVAVMSYAVNTDDDNYTIESVYKRAPEP